MVLRKRTEMVSPSIKLPSDKGKAASVDPVAPFPIKPRGCCTKVAGEVKKDEEKTERRPRPRNGESIAAIVFHHEGLFVHARNRNEAIDYFVLSTRGYV